MEKSQLAEFEEVCDILRRAGAFIRYVVCQDMIRPEMLLCGETGAYRAVEEWCVSELYAQKLIERDPRSTSLDQTPDAWSWEQRVATVQKFTRYVWAKQESLASQSSHPSLTTSEGFLPDGPATVGSDTSNTVSQGAKLRASRRTRNRSALG